MSFLEERGDRLDEIVDVVESVKVKPANSHLQFVGSLHNG